MSWEKPFLLTAHWSLGHLKLHSSKQPAGEKGVNLLWEAGGAEIAGTGDLHPNSLGFVPASRPKVQLFWGWGDALLSVPVWGSYFSGLT